MKPEETSGRLQQIVEGESTSRLLGVLSEAFEDEESRYAYVDSHLNASIAAQIRKLREAWPMTQGQLAERIGTKQSGVSRLENANYAAWKVETLRKIARALGLRLCISFEEFGTIVHEIEGFSGKLQKRRFEDDPIFNPKTSQRANTKTQIRKDATEGIGSRRQPGSVGMTESPDLTQVGYRSAS